jgi:hypothetical protein
LYLVSRAFERKVDKPIFGMQNYCDTIQGTPHLTIRYSDGKRGTITRSTSHGGFDNDVRTMNSIMARVLSKKPPKPFTEEEMKGY